MDASTTVLFFATVGAWLTFGAHQLWLSPSVRIKFVDSRVQPLTVSLLILLWRISCYLFPVAPIAVLVFVVSEPGSGMVTALAIVLLCISGMGWAIAGIGYPFLLGMIDAHRDAGHTGFLGRSARLAPLWSAIAVQLRPAYPTVEFLSKQSQRLRTRQATRRGPVALVALVHIVLVLAGFIVATVWIVTRSVMYALIVAIYTLPAWMVFAISEEQLQLLNERPFFVAYAVAVVALTELLFVMKERARRVKHAAGWSVALCGAEVAFVAIAIAIFDDPLLVMNSPAEAVIAAVVTAAVCVAAADVGQGLLSLENALHLRVPEPAIDSHLRKRGRYRWHWMVDRIDGLCMPLDRRFQVSSICESSEHQLVLEFAKGFRMELTHAEPAAPCCPASDGAVRSSQASGALVSLKDELGSTLLAPPDFRFGRIADDNRTIAFPNGTQIDSRAALLSVRAARRRGRSGPRATD